MQLKGLCSVTVSKAGDHLPHISAVHTGEMSVKAQSVGIFKALKNVILKSSLAAWGPMKSWGLAVRRNIICG